VTEKFNQPINSSIFPVSFKQLHPKSLVTWNWYWASSNFRLEAADASWTRLYEPLFA